MQSSSPIFEVDYKYSAEGDVAEYAYNNLLCNAEQTEIILRGSPPVTFKLLEPKKVIEKDYYYACAGQDDNAKGVSVRLRHRRVASCLDSWDVVRRTEPEKYCLIKFDNSEPDHAGHKKKSEMIFSKPQKACSTQLDLNHPACYMDEKREFVELKPQQSIAEVLKARKITVSPTPFVCLDQQRIVRDVEVNGKPAFRISMDDVTTGRANRLHIIEVEILDGNPDLSADVIEQFEQWLAKFQIKPEPRSKLEMLLPTRNLETLAIGREEQAQPRLAA